MSVNLNEPLACNKSRPVGARIRGWRRGVVAVAQEWPKWSIGLLATLIVGWLVLYPIGVIFDIGLHDPQGNWTLAYYLRVVTEPGLLSALVNSLIVSGAVTAICAVLALPMAWAVTRTNMPGGQVFRALTMVAFVVPNFIAAVAWILMLGPNAGMLNVLLRDTIGLPFSFNIYSVQGLIVILSASLYPLVFFAVGAALENMDPSYEEAAQMSGISAWRGSIQIGLPLVMPALLSSLVLVFLDAMGAFGAAAAVANGGRFHTLTTKIYQLFSYPPQFELAAAAVTPIILFTALGLLIQRSLLGNKRYTLIGGKSSRQYRIALGKGRWLLFGWCSLVVGLSVIVPAFVLLRTSFLLQWSGAFTWSNLTLDNYLILFDSSSYVPQAIANSFLVAGVTASVAVLLAIVVVWLVERSQLPGRGLLVFISTLTFAFPGLALAVGFVIGYSDFSLPLYGTLWLFFLAFIAQRFPFAFVFLRSAVKQLAQELEEAARMSGAGWLRTLTAIGVPLIKSGVLAAWLMTFAVALRELSIAILLYVPGTETLPVAIFMSMDDGRFPVAAALSVVLVLMSLLALTVLKRLAARQTARQ
ncbi:ABC transporter permease [Brenneria tiliae]|uniref:Iron ABC transporter permease n=1 Tax=Brenneria tiliae TaxID=2914984 RepID=A0ABT0MV44_9GAMM|nr:iron ABC transporter permease [Brenneria tiliae]MCL2893725.1 iron ABC transporter permease [Brenneria tiliae]